MLWNSALSWRWPFASVQDELVAMLKVATVRPLGICLSSGSEVRFPMSCARLSE